MKNGLKITVISTIIFVVTALFFQIFLPSHLFFREQCQLFLFSGEYFATYLYRPAPLPEFLSDFLTQFFYLRYAGATIIATLAVVEWNLFRITLNRINTSNTTLYALIPTIADVLIQCKIGHSLALQIATICMTILLILLIVFDSKSVNEKIKFALQLALVLAFTALCGAFSLIAILCYAIVVISNKRYSDLALPLILIVGAFVTLLFIRIQLVLPFSTVLFAPSKNVEFLIIATCTILSFAGVLFMKKDLLVKSTWLLLLAVVVTLCSYRYINFQREKYLYLDTQYYFGNHQNVQHALREMTDTQNRYISYYANLESARQGTLSDDLLQRYQPFGASLFIIPNPKINWHSMLIGYEAYALTGSQNMAAHAAMLGQTFSTSKRNVRATEYLAEINLLSGDTLAAKKYTRLLSKTLFHKKLRDRYIPRVLHRSDTIFSTSNITAQLKQTADENPHNQMTIDYLLCYQLLTKNLPDFFESIQKYKPQHYGRYYKEAMLIIASINKLNLKELGIEKEMIDRFFDYERNYKSGNRDYLKLRYSDTYWYYYHFAQKPNNE